jgi:peroxiredoxin
MKALFPLMVCSALAVFPAQAMAQNGAPSGGASAPKSSGAAEGLADLAIGQRAPEFQLPGIDGRSYTLRDFSEKRLLLVAFISNHCPDSHAAEKRLMALADEFAGKGLAVVAINPNNPEGLSLDELGYSKYNDGFEDMKRYAAEAGFRFPYLYDGETQNAAKAYGCLATPHLFLFDEQRALRYKGQLDDSRYADPDTVKASPAREAVLALLEGRPVAEAVTKPHGCSTKWLSKKGLVADKMEKWDKTPVDVEEIDAQGVAALRRNGTKKFRLFNVWATWCLTCVEEFPELVKTARKFGLRDFEFISLSVDEVEDAPKVKAFLEKRGAGLSSKVKASVQQEGRRTNSYVFRGAGPEELLKVLDPAAPGPIPHSILVGPNGEVLWRHTGEVDGEALRDRILEAMGVYYRP